MTFVQNIKVGTRLAVAFALLIAAMLAVAACAAWGLRSIDARLSAVVEDRYPKLKLASGISAQVADQMQAVRNALLAASPEQRDAALARIADTRQRVREAYQTIESRLNTDAGRQAFAALQKARQAYIAELDPLLAALGAGEQDAARQRLFGPLGQAQAAYLAELERFRGHLEALMEADAEASEAALSTTVRAMLAALALGAAGAAAIGWAVTRSVTQPLQQAVGVLSRVAEGDLTVETRATRRDELGSLLRRVDQTVLALRRVVGEVRSGVDSVTTASSQIAAGNQDLSTRTEQQAGALQQTAASMEEFGSRVQHSAESAREANAIAGSAREAAERGGASVGRVVATMEQISAASRKIADIIGVIDGIAFQTNILALNAAVEAARAGEQGRGFAVVAGEVRALAQRSASAAREIKSLIGQSVASVESGTRQVGEAGQTMADIVGQVNRVSALIAELSQATAEQSAGIGEVGSAVSEMDRATQQNAALVEESAAAAQSLADQARRLSEAIAVFRLQPA